MERKQLSFCLIFFFFPLPAKTASGCRGSSGEDRREASDCASAVIGELWRRREEKEEEEDVEWVTALERTMAVAVGFLPADVEASLGAPLWVVYIATVRTGLYLDGKPPPVPRVT